MAACLFKPKTLGGSDIVLADCVFKPKPLRGPAWLGATWGFVICPRYRMMSERAKAA